MESTDLLLQLSSSSSNETLSQSSCHIGLYVTKVPIIDQPKPDTAMEDDENEQENINENKDHFVDTYHFTACVLLPLQAKIGYIEWEEPATFFSLRTFLLQQHPTTCTIFTLHQDKNVKKTSSSFFTHENDVDNDIIDNIDNELTLTSCRVIRRPLPIDSTQQEKKIFEHILTTAISTTSSQKKDSKLNPKSMFTTAQIIGSVAYATEIIYHKHPNILIAIGIIYELLKTFVIQPLQYQNDTELAFQSSSLSGTIASNSLTMKTCVKKLEEYLSCLSELYLFFSIQIQTTLRIDENTLQSLGVTPSAQNLSPQMCLYGLLNKCHTACGSRLLQKWIRTPLLDIYQLNQRQLVVSCFLRHKESLITLAQQYKGIPDIEKIVTKLSRHHQQLSKVNKNTNDNNFSQLASRNHNITSDIIKEVLQLYFLSIKLRSILTTLSEIEIPTDDDKNDPLSLSSWFNGPHQATLALNVDYEAQKKSAQQTNINNDEIQPITYDPMKLATLSLTLCPEQYVKIKYTSELQILSHELLQFERLIEATIDFDALKNHEYLINPTLTDDLMQINKYKGKINRALERIYNDVLGDLNMDNSKLKMLYTASNNIGYYLRLSRKGEIALRGKKNYEILETRKDGIRFTTANFRKLSGEYQEQINIYHKIQFHMCYQLLDTVMTYCTVFQHIISILSELEVLMSFALLSQNNYVRPTLIQPGTGVTVGGSLQEPNTYFSSLSKGNNIIFDDISNLTADQIEENHKKAQSHVLLQNSRHPCLEQQPGLSYIPNDVELIHGKSELQLITGPNMGGKSSYLRCTALNVLLAQIGCFIPCDRGSIYLIDSILARVGAGDMQLKGISTFMKEMIETSELLHFATPQSLIIIDELGRGTSTYDGFGLAWGISEYLATKIHSFTLFATHFHEMTVMSNLINTVVNKHVTAFTSADTITMLYKIQPGHCDRSFGIHVAKMANFPNEVIALATQKVYQLEQYGSDNNILSIGLPQHHPLTNKSDESNSDEEKTINISNLSLSEKQAEVILQHLFKQNNNETFWTDILPKITKNQQTQTDVFIGDEMQEQSQVMSQMMSQFPDNNQITSNIITLYDNAMKEISGLLVDNN